MEEKKKEILCRIPIKIWGALMIRAGELSAEREKHVSANQLINEILEKELKKK